MKVEKQFLIISASGLNVSERAGTLTTFAFLSSCLFHQEEMALLLLVEKLIRVSLRFVKDSVKRQLSILEIL